MSETEKTESKKNLIPDGEYAGLLLSGKLIVSTKKGTQGYECIGQITEDGPYKGKKLIWHGWMGPDSSTRSMQALIDSGCTFPNDDTTNLDGIGSKEVVLVVGSEEYTPEPTEENPNPTMRKRNRIEWVNRGLGSNAGKEMDDAGKAAFKDVGKAALAAARAGRKSDGGSTEGLPKDAKTGRVKF
jgi:hypothetical protein